MYRLFLAIEFQCIRVPLDGDNNLRRVRINREDTIIDRHSIVCIGIGINSGRDRVFADIRTFFARERHILQGVFNLIEREETFGRIGEFRIFFAKGLGSVRNRQDNRLRSDDKAAISNFEHHVGIIERSIGEIFDNKSHGICLGIGACYSSIASIVDEIHRIGFQARRHVETAHCMFLAVINHRIRVSCDGDENFCIIRNNRECARFYGYGVVGVGFYIHDRVNGVFAQVFAFSASEFHILEFFHSAITFDKAFDCETKFGIGFAIHLRSIGNSQSDRLRSNRKGLFQNATKITDTGDRHGSNASFHVIRVAYDIIRLSGQGFAAFDGHDHSRRQRSAAINEFAFGKRGFVESDVSLPVGLECLVARLVIGNLDRFRRAIYAGAAPTSEHIPFLNRVVELERFGIFGEEHIGVGGRQSTAIKIVRNEERILESVVNPGNAFFHPVLHVIDFALVRETFLESCRVMVNILAKNIPLHEVGFGRNRIFAGHGQEHALHRSVQGFLLFVPAFNHVMNKQGVFEQAGCPEAVLDIPPSYGSNLAFAIITESHVEIPNRAVMQFSIGRIVELVNGGEILCIVIAGNLVHKEPVNNGILVKILAPAIHGILEIFTIQGIFGRLNKVLYMFLDFFGYFVGILQSNRSFSLFRFKPEFSIPPAIDFQDKATVEQIDDFITILVHEIAILNIFFRVIRNVLDINTTGSNEIPFAKNVISLIDAIPHHFYGVEGRIPFRIENVVRKHGGIDVTQQRLVGVVCDDAPFLGGGKAEKRLLLVELDGVSLLVH